MLKEQLAFWKVEIHCLWKLTTFRWNPPHQHVTVWTQTDKRRYDFCDCGYNQPPDVGELEADVEQIVKR